MNPYAVGFLVRVRIPKEDTTDMEIPTESPRFKDGWVRLDETNEDWVLTWVNSLGNPKVVWSQAEAVRLAEKMGKVITVHLMNANARYPVLV